MGCFSGVFSGFRHFNLQALPIDRLNETMAAMTVKAERSPAAVTLPPDTLTSTFGYLDLVDIPWAGMVVITLHYQLSSNFVFLGALTLLSRVDTVLFVGAW